MIDGSLLLNFCPFPLGKALFETVQLWVRKLNNRRGKELDSLPMIVEGRSRVEQTVQLGMRLHNRRGKELGSLPVIVEGWVEQTVQLGVRKLNNRRWKRLDSLPVMVEGWTVQLVMAMKQLGAGSRPIVVPEGMEE